MIRFGEDSQERMVDWLDDSQEVAKDNSILDLGCGNGALLLALVSEVHTYLHTYIHEVGLLAQSVERQTLDLRV